MKETIGILVCLAGLGLMAWAAMLRPDTTSDNEPRPLWDETYGAMSTAFRTSDMEPNSTLVIDVNGPIIEKPKCDYPVQIDGPDERSILTADPNVSIKLADDKQRLFGIYPPLMTIPYATDQKAELIAYDPNRIDAKDNFVRQLCESGRVCEVRGHQWDDDIKTRLSPKYVSRDDVARFEKCNLCGKRRHKRWEWIYD